MMSVMSRSTLTATRLPPIAALSLSRRRRLSFLVQCGLEDVHSRRPTVLPVPALAPPGPATSVPSATISLISCGLFHSAAVTSSGASPPPPVPCQSLEHHPSHKTRQRPLTSRAPGQLLCWGRSAGGRLGLGLSTTESKTAEKMVFVPTAVAQVMPLPLLLPCEAV
jgi:hypothetical protein